MKAKLLIASFSLLLLSSCIKDYIGKKNDIEITEDNYVFEGTVYQQYLTESIEATEDEIQELQEIIDNNQGDGQTEEDLAAAQEQLAYLSNELVNTNDLVGNIVGRIVPPRPPCPDADLCLPNGLLYLLTERDLGDFTFEVFDANGALLISADAASASPLRGSQNLLNFNELEETDYVGEVSIVVKRNDSQGNEVSYTLDSFQE